MTFNAMTEHYEEITVCGKPAQFTSIRMLVSLVGAIQRSKVHYRFQCSAAYLGHSLDDIRDQHILCQIFIPEIVADNVLCISKGYRLGPTQAAILTDAIKSRVDCRETSLRIFPSILEELENSGLASARTLANRLRPLLRNNVFEFQKTGSTSLPLSPNIHVFDLSGYPAGIRIILAELLLYDWFRSARALQTPIIIMVDEVQNLKLGRGTVLNQIITEGRRFSIGSILISQSLKAFSSDEQLALSQTGTKLFFKPPLTELRACSEMLAPPQHRAETAELLKTLKAGQCLLLSEYVYIGDETHPCTDCIQVNVDLPQSIK